MRNFLDIYSKKFKLDLTFFLTGGFWILLNEIINFTRGFILSLIFANYLSKELYGKYSLILTLISIASIFALASMSTIIIRSCSKNLDGTYNKINQEILKYSLIGSLIFIFYSIYDFFFAQSYTLLLFLVLAVIFPIFSISNNYQYVLYAKKEYKVLFILNFIYSLMQVLILGYIIIYSKFNLTYLILLTFIPQTILKFYYQKKIEKNYLSNNLIDYENIAYGKKLNFTRAITTFLFSLDALIVAHFLGYESLAIYTIVILIPNQAKNTFKAFSPLIIYKLSKQKFLKEDINKYFKLLMSISLLSILIYALISKSFFSYFYPQYANYYYLSIIAFIGVIYIPAILFELAFQEKMSNENIKNEMFSAIINLILVIIFVIILGFGIFSILISNLVARAFTLMYSYFKFNKS